MRSKSPFRQDKCTAAWDKMKKKYETKGPNGLKEYNAEKNEFYCDNGKIKPRPFKDDGDAPMSDAEIKAMKEKKKQPEFGKRKKSIVEQ